MINTLITIIAATITTVTFNLIFNLVMTQVTKNRINKEIARLEELQNHCIDCQLKGLSDVLNIKEE